MGPCSAPGRVEPREPVRASEAKMVDYSVWDHIEVSDDEDETHPNIDTASLFRWRHQVGLCALIPFPPTPGTPRSRVLTSSPGHLAWGRGRP